MRHVDWVPSSAANNLHITRRGDDVIVEWSGVGTLVHGPNSESVFVPHPDADPSYLEKFRSTGLVACLRYLQGKTCLHGSAVALPSVGGAIVLIGESGAGKSTTAMSLVENHGGVYLSDGVVPIDWHGPDPVVTPVNQSFWLLPDALEWFGVGSTPPQHTHKRPRSPKARTDVPERVKAIVVLEFDDSLETPTLERLTGDRTFSALSRAHICYAVNERADALQNLTVRSQLASSVKFLHVCRRRALDALSSTARLLLSNC